MSFLIDSMRTEDWEEVRGIYLEGIATGNATFETDAPSWEHWDAAHVREPRLVARDDEGLGALRLCRRRGGQRLCRRIGPRPRCGTETSRGPDRTLRSRRDLDASG